MLHRVVDTLYSPIKHAAQELARDEEVYGFDQFHYSSTFHVWMYLLPHGLLPMEHECSCRN
jgi:hypothetical protein